MNIEDITVVDTLGHEFPLTDCTLLCPKMGEMDYGDPHAVIYPDGQTPMLIDALDLIGPDRQPVDPEEIDW